MNKIFIIAALLLFAVSGLVFGAGASASYIISSSVLDAGSGAANSTSFKMLGKLREQQLVVAGSAGFSLSAGFLKSSYFSQAIVLSPVVTAISPSSGINSGTISITDLSGANFQAGASVKLSKSGEPDIVATNVVVVSSSKITCSLDLSGKAAGLWNVIVTNSDGRSGTLPAAFTIAFAAPVVTAITPKSGLNNALANIIDLAGSNFRSGAQVRLSKTGETDIIADNVAVVASTKITCQFNLVNKATGFWDIVVTNSDNQSARLAQGFKVESPSIQIVGKVESTQNPFNPSVKATAINYTLSKDADITVSIFNIRGEKEWERSFVAGQTGATTGANSIPWDGLTDFQAVASFGVHIVIITTKQNGSVVELGRTKIAVIK
ncbi:hypothetical protein A2311_01200 [candidate division WOR-1 bacterium RIFOXYB2_FULL_48_7]|uniref:IPT/TIG domain-containing protein n=1 Tax=candidate division WOR-1 bacterium RIFOXYB2_FULL_48_7 TaxID=1802583 RepID=A0A1F4TNL5_UNCSA|nr:MAG: hypothetical protein A2311_01200 [candidate division WOR-1 bacterium RIFOXYB2_FULL_48_7]